MSAREAAFAVLRPEELAELVRAAVATALAEAGATAAPPLLNREQLAQVLAVSTPTVDRLRAKGMPCVRVLDALRFDVGAVRAWLASRDSAR